jgi:hypothetical protein
VIVTQNGEVIWREGDPIPAWLEDHLTYARIRTAVEKVSLQYLMTEARAKRGW